MTSIEYLFPLNLNQCRNLEKTSRENKLSKYSRYISPDQFELFITSKLILNNKFI